MRSIRHAHTKYHPLTGAPIVPVGYRRNGDPIWPIMGGSGEGEGGDGSGDGDGAGGEGDADAEGGDDGGDGKVTEPPADETPEAKATRLEAEVTRLRRENAGKRVSAKDAAEEVRKAVLADLSKALGGDTGSKVPTVDELKSQLTEQTTKTEQAAAVARDTQAELVVWQNATTLGVDAGALTDSRAFASAIKDLDPTDAKFVEDVKKAAQEAAEKNPKLKATQAAGSSSADHGGTGGGTTSKTPKSLDAAVSGHYGS